MAAKIPEFSYSCEICGVEGLNDEEMRSHMVVYHLDGAASCPFCDLGEVSAEEMLTHVNTAHLDYLTPERELLAFIDDEDDCDSDMSKSESWGLPAQPQHNGWANNNNNNNNSDEERFGSMKSSAGPSCGAGQGSPLRSNLALNLQRSTGTMPKKQQLQQQCFLCAYKTGCPLRLEEHINRQHFDLTSPSFPPSTPREAVYNCPLCIQTFQNSEDLELHVNIEHKDILSPAKPTTAPSQPPATWNESCPVCCMTNFSSSQEMAVHIEDHFNQKGATPVTPDVSSDRLLAREIEKREREVRRQREQHEFEMLRAQYGMDNQGNFREQSLTNMQKAVYAGELSVADYYERQIELRAAENNGVDDGSSCTKELVPNISAVSASSPNVVSTFMCTTVDHYASTYGDKGWGCGYRNMQMLLSSLLHHTGYNEQLYKPTLGWRAGRSAMPSISRLQQLVEWAWTQGFDQQGCDQLGGKLFNTRKWIGATEVVTVLSSLRIRCQLVDFHCPTCLDGSHPEMFNWVLEYFQSKDDFKPPLYLQHQGHSRTIVGVEVLKDGALCLLVLDPSHSPHQMSQFSHTSTAPGAMRLIRKSLAAMKARQYQVVSVCGIMDTEHEYQVSPMDTQGFLAVLMAGFSEAVSRPWLELLLRELKEMSDYPKVQ